jgi:hypothetical protein
LADTFEIKESVFETLKKSKVFAEEGDKQKHISARINETHVQSSKVIIAEATPLPVTMEEGNIIHLIFQS